MKKGQLPSLLSPKTDRILFRKPSNSIPKIILMIDDSVIDLPTSLDWSSSYYFLIINLVTPRFEENKIFHKSVGLIK